MTIDEAIEQQKEKAKLHRESIIPKDRYYNMPHVDSANKSHTFYAEEHERIAEWLEELKAYRENSNGYNKEDIELNRNAMYNKAIDDLLEDANEMAIEVDTGTYTMKAIGIGLLEQIAEQLKVGEKNERRI